jgi:hypothetical protein
MVLDLRICSMSALETQGVFGLGLDGSSGTDGRKCVRRLLSLLNLASRFLLTQNAHKRYGEATTFGVRGFRMAGVLRSDFAKRKP